MVLCLTYFLMAGKKQTPMMQQYWEYRNALPADTLLLFRLGDFYEMFHEDAREGARLLGITLTKRQDYPMAGMPYHAAQTYLNKLLKLGKKVAIVDQMETPQAGKLVKRALTRILTPGTMVEDSQIEANRNHFLLAVDVDKQGMHAAWLDLSTGEFQIATDQRPENLLPVFNSMDPREIIVPEEGYEAWAQKYSEASWYQPFLYLCEQTTVSRIADYHFESASGARMVHDALGVLNLDGFGIEREHAALGAAGAVIFYATESLCRKPENLSRVRQYRSEQSLLIDPATLRNLEIFKSAANTREGSLMQAIDRTVTPAGARLLEQYLSEPLLDLKTLEQRQQCVQVFLDESGAAGRIHHSLQHSRDLARILARLQNKIRNPRELGGIRATLEQLPEIRAELQQIEDATVQALAKQVHPFDGLRDLLCRALADELPGKLQEGGLVRDGYDEELDRLRSLSKDNKTWLADLEAAEQARTGIKNLKIKYNGAFGYFIEVTKANLHLVPEDYIRKQTMTNAERYYTQDLKQKEKEILNAEEKAIVREEALFQQLVQSILDEAVDLAQTAQALAQIDLFIGWSFLARDWDYCRPELDEGDVLSIEQGRHPVVEQMLRVDRMGMAGSHGFVPNDTNLSIDAEQIALITGPNMAGKSTYIRQVALIALLAQMGCWVPARSCKLGLVDRIFSRVGASDELARGNSTFMVEMNETANILNNATERSLIILDEIGRGTSTYDGLSIAWSVVEHVHGTGKRGARTLFATHYHELTRLAESLPRLRNYCVSVKEWNDEIIFVRQVVEGAADRSYGIQVARLAGLPESVIERAKVILEELESEGSHMQEHLREAQEEATPSKRFSKKSAPKTTDTSTKPQLELF